MDHNYDDYINHYNDYVNEELNAMPSNDEIDHECESVLTADGYGAYCPVCGETTE